jgi:hypothetical protein
MWVVIIPSKDCTTTAIKEIQAQAKGESRWKLRALCVNYGYKFTPWSSPSIPHDKNSPSPTHYVTQTTIENHHGMSEWHGGGCGERHAQGKRVAWVVWGEVVSTSVYVLNKCPTKSVDQMTPSEAWHRKL